MPTALPTIPDYLTTAAADLGCDTNVRVLVVGDSSAVAEHFAGALFDEIARKPDATLIVPVGPVDQFPLLTFAAADFDRVMAFGASSMT